MIAAGSALRGAVSATVLALVLLGCQSAAHAPLDTVARVDVPRFMGRWYVIACIPTYLERDAYDATETYVLDPRGRVRTEFTYRHGSFSAKQRRLTPVGYVLDGSGAHWGMQFIWPFKSDYRITYLNADYTQTIVARVQRDYVWIMARTPAISAVDYAAHIQRVRDLGYDLGKLRQIPHSERSIDE